MAAPKPKTEVFVDYEYLYFSILNEHNRVPDLKLLYDTIAEYGHIVDMWFIANFTDKDSGLMRETSRIRQFTGQLIESVNPDDNMRKDFSDFVLADVAYRQLIKKLISKDSLIEQYVLVTGDGHLSSLASTMKYVCGAKVGVVGIPNTVSGHLRRNSDWCEYYEFDKILDKERKQEIILNILRVQAEGMRPNFMNTCTKVADKLNVQTEDIKKCLQELLNRGVVIGTREPVYIGSEQTLTRVDVDFEKAEAYGLAVGDAPALHQQVLDIKARKASEAAAKLAHLNANDPRRFVAKGA